MVVERFEHLKLLLHEGHQFISLLDLRLINDLYGALNVCTLVNCKEDLSVISLAKAIMHLIHLIEIVVASNVSEPI